MPSYLYIWDEDENLPHIEQHGVTPEEAEYVIEHPTGHARNRDGDPIAFGYTRTGRHLAVVYVQADAATLRVSTAYDVPPRMRRERRRI